MEIIRENISIKNMIRKLWIHFCSDSLFRNSVYMMLTTGVMAGFGFFFWLLNARLFSTEDIGLATTLISVMGMIAMLSLIGFDTAFVRFLPKSDQKNNQLNTGFLLVGATAFVVSLLFVVFLPVISAKISFIRENPFTALAFILFCVVSALNILAEAVFLANRKTKFTLIITSIFSVIKIILPLFFIGWGALGVFSAVATAQLIGFALNLAVMIRKLDYRPKFTINRDVLKHVWKYCFGNYVAGFFNLLPVALLPLVITNRLGPEQAAYYYVVMMIGNLLYVIPQATTKSLFAEGSHDEKFIAENIRKSIKIISLLLFPGIIVLLAAGGSILRIFGKSYSTDGLNFLYFVAVTGIAVAAYVIFNSLFKIKKDLRAIIATSIVYSIAVIGIGYMFLPLGLVGIGIALLAGNIVASLVSYILYRSR